MQNSELTDKQRAFVDEYLIDLNATQAAIRAGYSVKESHNAGAQLMGRNGIAEAVSRALAERSRRTGVTADRVVRELARIAFADITDVASLGEAEALGGAGRDDTAAIQSVKVRRTPTEHGDAVEREVKLYDKGKALDQLCRHLGMYNDKLSVGGGVSVVFAGEGELED